MQRPSPTAALGIVLALAGCRYAQDDKGLFVDPRDDYLDAEPSAALTVPEGLSSVRIADAWPIPEIDTPPAAKVFPRQAPRPAVLVGRDLDAVRIQKLGDRVWMVVGDAPEQVWPTVKQFLADNGVGIGREDPPAGVIESVWIVVTDQDYDDVVRTAIQEGRKNHLDSAGGTLAPGRDRMQFRVERGIRRGSTEVHISHRRAVGGGDETSPAIAEVEAEVLTKLAEYSAQGLTTASVSMVGRDIAPEAKAQLVKDETGYPSLRLNVDFDRAWATVGQALQRAEIEVAETDRDSAVYRAVFPTAGRRGWLKRLVPGGEAGRDTPVTIHVENAGEGIVLRVATPDGEPVTDKLAEEVLVTLREFAA